MFDPRDDREHEFMDDLHEIFEASDDDNEDA